jgi:hypothetical protein
MEVSFFVWYWGLNLRFHHCRTWVNLQSFCSAYFGDKVSLFAHASLYHDTPVLNFPLFWSTILPISASHLTWDQTFAPGSAIGWEGVSLMFYLGWHQTEILQISASQVVRLQTWATSTQWNLKLSNWMNLVTYRWE